MLLSFWPNLCLEIGFSNNETKGCIGLHFDSASAKLLLVFPLLSTFEILFEILLNLGSLIF